MSKKNTILIVDDIELNRSMLIDMIGEEYDTLEAENGEEAISVLSKVGTKVSVVLLDMVMPKMDGFKVLEIMNNNGWIDDIPVIMISAENNPKQIEKAYKLGVTDFINRPFDEMIVRKRIQNTILVYTKQKKLIEAKQLDDFSIKSYS